MSYLFRSYITRCQNNFLGDEIVLGIIKNKNNATTTTTSYLEAKTYELCSAIKNSEMFAKDLIQHKYYESMFTSLFLHSLKKNNWKMLQIL